jgi:hypothetical protein
MQTNDLTTSLANTLRAAHEAAQQAAEQGREAIQGALERAADVGLLVEEAKSVHHAGFHEWLRAHVPTLSKEQAEIYFGVHRVRKKRQTLEIDHRQLKLIGIIGDEDLGEDGSRTAQRADSTRWVKWAGHVASHLREVDIAKLQDFERKAMADQLKPIVEAWGRLCGRTVPM